MDSRNPVKVMMSSICATMSALAMPSADAPMMMLRRPERSPCSAAPTASRTGCDEASTAPLSGGSSPASEAMSVLLPEPLRPMTPMASPGIAVNVTPRRALTST